MQLRLSVATPGTTGPGLDPVTGVADVLVRAAADTPLSAVAASLRAVAGVPDGTLYAAGRIAHRAALGLHKSQKAAASGPGPRQAAALSRQKSPPSAHLVGERLIRPTHGGELDRLGSPPPVQRRVPVPTRRT